MEEEIINKEEEKKKSKIEIKAEKLEKVRKEEEELFNAISHSKYESLCSDCYTEMDSFIEMVCRGISYGTIIHGKGGLGKTHRALNKALKIVGNSGLAYTDSFTTPQALYIWMFKNRLKEVLIIDDVAGLLKNEKILAFLKGALWDVNGKRIINYMTTKHMEDEDGDLVPNSFELEANIIILTNEINLKKNGHLDAVMSRVDSCEVVIPLDELLNILEDISKNDYRELSVDERMQCFNFLKSYAENSTINLNIRTLFKLFNYMIYAKRINKPNLFKILGEKVLKSDEDLVIVETLLRDKSFKKEQQRIAQYKKLTNRSKNSFYRAKERLINNGFMVDEGNEEVIVPPGLPEE